MNKLKPKERAHTWYWSSTEASCTIAWTQKFASGSKYYIKKNSSSLARAVRKVKK